MHIYRREERQDSARRHDQKRPTTVSKETYYSVKRDLPKRGASG